MKFDHTPTIREILDRAAATIGEKPFIKFVRNGAVIQKTFAEVREDSLAFCRRLRVLSKEPAHIALMAKSSYEYIVCLTGILISGNVAIPVAPDTPTEATVKLFDDADVTYVLYGQEIADKMEEVKKQCPCLKGAFNLQNEEAFENMIKTYNSTSPYAQLSDIKVDEHALALIIYTSGSTGDRKGVMLSGYALVENTMFTPVSDYVVNDDVLLSVLPMYHIFCFVSDYLGSLMHENTLCLNGDIRDLFQNMLLFKPGTMRIVPMIAQAILSRINAVAAKNTQLTPEQAAAQVTGGELKWLLSGGAYLDPAVCRAYEKYGMFLRQGYGMSEAGCKITVPDVYSAVDSVGRAMDILNVRVQNGEIQVDTPCKMLGYYKMPEETKKMFTEDGWLKTGDIGHISSEREIFITGRVKNLIILSNGENVSPEALEKKLKEHLLVSECLVYAENDRILADIFADEAYAALHGISDIPKAIEAIVDEMNLNALPSHTIAQIIIKNEPLPKGPTGKILRK